jgi:MoxR-like ATPase
MTTIASRLRILHAAMFTPANRHGRLGLTVLFEGDPGTAKSDAIEEYVHETLGMHCEVLSPSERGEAAFGATPYPVQAKKGGPTRISYPTPDWLDAYDADIGGAVFVDEANTVNPVLQAPMMGLIGARRIGGALLPDNVRVIGACNPVDIATNGHDFEPALANRWCFLRWDAPSPEERRAYNARVVQGAKLREPVDTKAEEARVRAAWPAAYARAISLENAFFAACPTWKNKMPGRDDPRIHRAWPSDRSWANATRAHAASMIHGLSEEERDEFIAGFVGEAACQAFTTWMEKADLPNAEDVLDGRTPFVPDHRMDRNGAVLTACAAIVSPKECPNRVARAKRLWELMLSVSTHSMDVVIPAALDLASARLIPAEADTLLARLDPILEAAGIGGKGRA